MNDTDQTTKKVAGLLEQHKMALIEELGPSAFDRLSPAEARRELGLSEPKYTQALPDLIRRGWLEPVPGADIGNAHLYYRWRIEFVRRHKRRYGTHVKEQEMPVQ